MSFARQFQLSWQERNRLEYDLFSGWMLLSRFELRRCIILNAYLLKQEHTMHRMTLKWLLLACVLFSGWSSPLGAQVSQLDLSSRSAVNLQPAGRLFRARDYIFPEQFADIPAWQTQQQAIGNVSLLGGHYWLMAEIRHESDVTDWVFAPQNTLIERVEARVYADNGQVQRLATGYQHDSQYMLHYGKRIQLQPGTTYRLLVRFSGPYFASHPEFELAPEADYRRQVAVENTLVLTALGALISLAAFNLFIFFTTRDKSQLYYALYLLAYFIAWAFVFHLPVELFGYRNLAVHYVPFFLLPVLNTLFYPEFLQLKDHFPRLAQLSRMNMALALLLLPSCFFALSYAHTLATVVITIWFVLALVSGIFTWRSGYRPARYFVFAFIALILPGLFILPANVGLTPELIDNAEMWTLLGGTVDALLLAFALADKIKLLAEQKDGYLKRLNNSLEMANADGLTGLGNRYAFDCYLDQYFEFSPQTEGEDQQLLVLIDLDGLKDINDTYGHSAGDQVLRLFADGMRTWCDEQSRAYRLGGDEFAILSCKHQEKTLREILAKVETTLIDAGFPDAGVSYGIAFAAESDSPGQLFNISDRRMYRYKLARRLRRESRAGLRL
jgi:diguanylate cyclase (GGDEF)-like protein